MRLQEKNSGSLRIKANPGPKKKKIQISYRQREDQHTAYQDFRVTQPMAFRQLNYTKDKQCSVLLKGP